ncbi:MAG TPA: DUF192 domain-containing protein [Candidatus Binataceae bacterium]|nr:DUF192 domain-containing protein [Candidatus Binataceae bacterium]
MATLVRAINRTRGTILCERLEQAVTSRQQSRGLLGRQNLEPGTGMLFRAARLSPFMWMHMFFMKFPIDIVFLNRDGRVLRINHRLQPWRFSSMVFGARQALEITAGRAETCETQVGDHIIIERI